MDLLTSYRQRKHRHARIRARVFGTTERPRLVVFRSNEHIYGQLIDDTKGITLVAVNDGELLGGRKAIQSAAPLERRTSKSSTKKQEKGKEAVSLGAKISEAYETGKLIARKAGEKKISKAIFDRAGYKYHGRVKAFAEGAREGGLMF